MIDTNLTSISTYGWWTGEGPGEAVLDTLEPVSTYGWWTTVVVIGEPDIVEFLLCVNRTKRFNPTIVQQLSATLELLED